MEEYLKIKEEFDMSEFTFDKFITFMDLILKRKDAMGFRPVKIVMTYEVPQCNYQLNDALKEIIDHAGYQLSTDSSMPVKRTLNAIKKSLIELEKASKKENSMKIK